MIKKNFFCSLIPLLVESAWAQALSQIVEQTTSPSQVIHYVEEGTNLECKQCDVFFRNFKIPTDKRKSGLTFGGDRLEWQILRDTNPFQLLELMKYDRVSYRGFDNKVEIPGIAQNCR